MIAIMGDSAMSSKIAFSLLFLSLLGCNIHLNEKPPIQRGFNLKLTERLGCLSHSFQALRGFINGTASEPEIRETWVCFGDAIGIYQKFVQGQESDRYQAREVANFFQKYFLND